MAGASSPHALHSAIVDIFLKYAEKHDKKQQIEGVCLDERYNSAICEDIAENS